MTRKPEVARYALYVLECGDGTLYAGIALDVAARLAKHVAGTGARYTRGRGPLLLRAKTWCRDRSHALRVELRFKALSREEKLRVSAHTNSLRAFVRHVSAELG